MSGWLDSELLAQIGCAVLFGGIIGLEREFSDKPAGLRTNVLICVGSMLFTVASLRIAGTRGDPGRVAAQVVTGVGFLGAGAIIQSRGSVVGLTTAATIWVVAAIGVLTGLGRFMTAANATVITVLVLWLVRKPEEHIARKIKLGRLRIEMPDSPQLLVKIAEVFRTHGAPMEQVSVEKAEDGRVAVTVRFPVSMSHRKQILQKLQEIEDLHSVKETIL